MIARIAALTLFSAVTLTACDSGNKPAAGAADKPAEAAQVVAKADHAAKAEHEKSEGEDGCIYGDKQGGHGDKHAEHAEHGDKHKGEESSCGHHAAAGAAPSGEPGHYGAAFAMTESKPLREVLGAAAPAGAVQVTGQIDSVCQKAGCWLVIKDGEAHARVLMKDHSFTVPMDSKGKGAVVEGTIETRTFDEKQVKHLEKDGGGDPAAVAGERTEYVLTASAIKITNS